MTRRDSSDRLQVASRVREALASGAPVVALESALITHGLPRPTNLKTASRLEEIVREEGRRRRRLAWSGGG